MLTDREERTETKGKERRNRPRASRTPFFWWRFQRAPSRRFRICHCWPIFLRSAKPWKTTHA